MYIYIYYNYYLSFFKKKISTKNSKVKKETKEKRKKGKERNLN